MQLVVMTAAISLAAGPLLHHVAVAVGNDRSLLPREARCRRCGASHGRVMTGCRACGLGVGRIVAFSVVLALVGAGFAAELGAVAVLPAYFLFAAMTAVLLVTDIDHKRIPNRITYPGTPLAALLLAGGAFLDGTPGSMLRAGLAALVYSGVLFVVFLVARGGFGFGDVKLAVPIGLFLGYLGWERLVVGAFATAFLGGLVAIGALVLGRAGAKSEIPYGPPMIVGAWAAVIWGSPLAGLLL